MPVGKIIIQHGDRVTEHDVGDEPLVVGRDPKCDLFFADKKLSRRHARFERADNRVKLVDLGSRNGCWVNEERVEERLLAEGDSIRLGSLQIGLVAGAESAEEGDSTMLLLDDTPTGESGTVVLSSASLPDAARPGEKKDSAAASGEPGEDADASGTVLLPGMGPSPPPPEDEEGGEDESEDLTLQRDSETPDADRTVVLSGAVKPPDSDTGTVIFRGQADPSLQSVTPLGTGEPRLDAEPEEILDELSREAPEDTVGGDELAEAPRARSRTLEDALLVAGLALFAVLVLALPLVRTFGRELTAESTLRARALIDLLAATNEPRLEGGRLESLSLARVLSEPGVIEAYIFDARGKHLSPGDVEGSPFLKELEEEARSLRTFRRREAANGDLVLLKPIRKDGRRLGVAVLRYRVPESLDWMLPLGVGVLLLLMGLGGALVLAHRWTLAPVAALRDDVEDLTNGYLDWLPEKRPYAELHEIARGFNLLLKGEPSPGEGGENAPSLLPARDEDGAQNESQD